MLISAKLATDFAPNWPRARWNWPGDL